MEIPQYEIELIRTRLLNAIRVMVITNDGFDQMYFVGLKHNVPNTIRKADTHINDLCNYEISWRY